MSMRRSGLATPPFMRSKRFVPPAMNCAPGCDTRRNAPSMSAARAYEKLCTASDLSDGRDNVGIGTAAAQVAAHALAYGPLRQGIRGFRPTTMFLEQRHGGADLARCAKAALKGVMPQKSRLNRV